MPKPSSVGDFSSVERDTISRTLHLGGVGAGRTELRGDFNARYGDCDLLQVVMDKVALDTGEVIIDVACGTGGHLERYAKRVGIGGQALGVDFDPGAVAAARGRGLRVEQATADALPFESATADVVTCNYAIYYFPNVAQALAEVRRVCKPRGRIAITGPALGTNLELFAFHERATGRASSDADRMALGFVAQEVPRLLEHEGFFAIQLEEVTNHVTFPDVTSFLDYWTATSLYARTGISLERARQSVTQIQAPLVITKRTTVLTAIGR